MLAVHNRFKTSNMGWVGQIKDKREPVHHEAEAEGSLYCSVPWRGARRRRTAVQGEAALASKEMSWGSGSALPFSASEASAFVSSCELKARYYRLYNTMVGEGLTSFDNHIMFWKCYKKCVLFSPSASEASAFVSSCELKARYYRLYNTINGEGLASFDNNMLKNVIKNVSCFPLRPQKPQPLWAVAN